MSDGTPGYVSLRRFWRTFARHSPAWSRRPLPFLPSLLHGLNAYFGELTFHTVVGGSADELRLACLGCKNAAGAQLAHVCETHMGVLEGTAELAAGDVEASYQPARDGTCLVVLRRRR